MAAGMGSWSTRCAQDPRFNMDGRGMGSLFGCLAINDAILAKQKELGLTDEQMNALTIEVEFWKD